MKIRYPESEEYLQTLGGRMRFIRRNIRGTKKIPQAQTARWAGVGLRVYQSYEMNKVVPGADKLSRLLQKFSEHYPHRPVDTNWVLLGRGEPFMISAFDLIMDVAFGPVIIVEDGNIISLSEQVLDMTGFEHYELEGIDVHRFVLLEEGQDLPPESLPDSTRRTYEAKIATVDDAPLSAEVSGKIVDYGGHKLHVVLLRNILGDADPRLEVFQLMAQYPDTVPLVLDYLRGKNAAKRMADRVER